MCYHETFAIPYVAIVAGFYGFDRVLRLVQTRIVTAQLRPIPELGMTRIEVPSVNAGWRAGQHVRIRVLSSGMGAFGWMESHPFTIASVSKVRSSPAATVATSNGLSCRHLPHVCSTPAEKDLFSW